MIKVNVKNDAGVVGWTAIFEAEELADAWIAQESNNKSWGEVFEVEKLDLGIAPLVAEIRRQRNALLAECDYTQLADSPLSAEKKQEYADYRQALRDITQHVAEDGTVEWPVKPE